MVQSINNLTNASVVQTQIYQDKTEKTIIETKTTEKETELSAEDTLSVGVSSHGDTIEISKQGMSKVQSVSTSSDIVSTEQIAETETESTATKTAQSIIADASDDTYDLSQYSEYELKQMLTEGTISSAEYNQEIESREEDRDNDSIEQKKDVVE